MRNNINIFGNNQTFNYIIEYKTSNTYTDGYDIQWHMNRDCVYLFEGDIQYYRKHNDWYKVDALQFVDDYMPEQSKLSRIRVYLPAHSINTYVKNIKYAVTCNTYINGKKIDLGSYIFKPIDTVANEFGPIKNGNNEYHEYVEFDILDPYDIVYSDSWMPFRNLVCGEPKNINNTGSLLTVTLYVVDEYDDRYMMKDGCVGGATAFNIVDDKELFTLDLSLSLDPLGFKLTGNMNKEYDWLLNYIYETYGLSVSHNDIFFELVIKNNDSVIVGPTVSYNATEDYGTIVQTVLWRHIKSNNGFKTFFDSWENFEAGWSIVGSIYIKYDNEEVLTFVSNELPITQELFSLFTNGGTSKIIDLNDMNVVNYNVINKIENNIVQIERPNDSKSNIIQPVFFKVKELETLTLHPAVTENICINLDDYKSKVDKFTLQIAGCMFEQIGANQYGIIFKLAANKLPADAISGIYYVLNENLELVTTGKYNCIR